jgi:2-iminobutanoate/2-iminopropanoate deaminase
MPKHVPDLPGIEPTDLPLSQCVEAGGLVFVAGQVGSTPGSHGAVPGGIGPETRAMLDNVGRILRAVGLDYGDVVKCTVYLLDFGEFAAMNAVYREYFPTEPPTRATVGVMALAAGFRIEIEVIAAR